MRPAKFRGAVIEGHKGVVALVVPFDPRAVWELEPIALAGRRHGWPVVGRIGRKRFTGYIGERWGRFFVMLDAAALGVRPGDTLSVSLEPTRDAEVIAAAVAQSRATTQPRKARKL
ncbi:MAG TPA: hypothetical protein VFF72_04235 [Caldimonas sp.]|nr:hypothetical protein [Caldimonas sp.]